MFDELKQKEKVIAESINSINSGTEGLFPVIDGIINIEKYMTAKLTILWILKEVHDDWSTVSETKEKRCGGWNQAHGYNAKTISEIRKLVVANRIMKTTKSILEKYLDCTNLSEDEKQLEAFKSIAYINIKKIPGGKIANKDEIKKAFYRYKDIIYKQIEVYNPDVIICGNTLQYLSDDNFFEKKNRLPTGLGTHHYYPLEEKVFIQAYHPAYKPKSKEFEDLYVKKITDAVNNWIDNYRVVKNDPFHQKILT
jgi:hypothetical protein